MKKILSALTAVLVAAFSLTACAGGGESSSAASSAAPSSEASSEAAPASSASSEEAKLTGSVNISGSSALQPLVQAAAEQLKAKNPDLAMTVNAGGSGTGLQNVADKTVDIGNSDVFAEEKLDASKASALVDHQVCVVGVAAVANPGTGVTNVKKQQLIDIFTGKIKNWKEVGGKDQAIVIVNRPKSSGTRALFKQFALDGQEEKVGKALTEDNSGTLKQTVAQTPGAIAYLAFSYLNDDTATALSLDDVKPAYDNIYSGKYPIWGYEHMYTNGEATGTAKAVIDYIKGDDFSSTVTKMGYGLISKMTVKREAPKAKS